LHRGSHPIADPGPGTSRRAWLERLRLLQSSTGHAKIGKSCSGGAGKDGHGALPVPEVRLPMAFGLLALTFLVSPLPVFELPDMTRLAICALLAVWSLRGLSARHYFTSNTDARRGQKNHKPSRCLRLDW